MAFPARVQRVSSGLGAVLLLLYGSLAIRIGLYALHGSSRRFSVLQGGLCVYLNFFDNPPKTRKKLQRLTAAFWVVFGTVHLLSGLEKAGFLAKLVEPIQEILGRRVGQKIASLSALMSICELGPQKLERLLSEFTQGKNAFQDQLKLQMKVAQDLNDQLVGFKRQVDQLGNLPAPLPTMDKKIEISQAESDASSSCTASIGSWAYVDAGRPCCFLPDTYFMVMTADDGEILVPAKKLFKGAEVIAANGKVIEVAHPPEQHRVDAVIELQAGQSFLVVSPDHRILIPGNKTVPLPD